MYQILDAKYHILEKFLVLQQITKISLLKYFIKNKETLELENGFQTKVMTLNSPIRPNNFAKCKQINCN